MLNILEKCLTTNRKEETIIFGKYALGRILGEGAFAEVYLARNVRTGESVAIKIISKARLQDTTRADARVKTEISVMKTLNHPNIVQLYEVMANKRNIYLVMEYINGGTLYERIYSCRKRKAEEEHTSRRYFQQLISAVDFCHKRRIYHRDIKANNLLLDDKGNLKVADFGMSTFQEQVREDGLFHTQYGYPCYLAPEVISGEGYKGARADIWSCGVILYELFVRHLPFDSPNLDTLLKKMQRREYSFPKGLPCEVRVLLFRMLDPNPSTRITIPEIMEVPWFKVGFNGHNLSFHNHDSNGNMSMDFPNPPCLNAFSILASWPKGLDLAPLFGGSTGALRFMSKEPVSAIISKFQEIAKANGLSLRSGSEWTLNMEGMELGVEAEITQVAPSLYAVDVSKTCGDTDEYKNFRDRHVIPALRDIGWAWQENQRSPRDEKCVTLRDQTNELVVNSVLLSLMIIFGTFIVMSLMALIKKF